MPKRAEVSAAAGRGSRLEASRSPPEQVRRALLPDGAVRTLYRHCRRSRWLPLTLRVAGAIGGFKFGGAGAAEATSPKGAKPAFSFGGGGAAGAGAGAGGGFKFGGGGDASADKPAGGGFKFGAGAATSGGGAGGGGFKFGGGGDASADKPAAGASKAFSFGGGAAPAASGGFAFKTSAPAAADSKEDEDEAPDLDQKPDIVKSKESDTESTVEWGGAEEKIKMFTLTDTKQELEERVKKCESEGADAKDLAEAKEALEKGRKTNFKQWKPMGSSTISVVKDKASAKLMLRMRSENGQRFLLNDWASSTKANKQKKLQMTLITPGPKQHMLKFTQTEHRDELFDIVNGKEPAPSASPAAAASKPAKSPASASPAAAASPAATAPAASAKRKASSPAEAPSLSKVPAAASFSSTSASFSFGAKSAAKSSPPAAKSAPPTKSIFGNTPKTSPLGASPGTGGGSAGKADGAASAKDKSLFALNKAFLAHITKHVEANETCDLSPCLKDYLKHIRTLG